MGDQAWTIEHPQGLTASAETTTTGFINATMSVPYNIDMPDGVTVDVNLINATLKPGLPALNSVHPNDPFLFVKSITFGNQGAMAFTAAVNYESIGDPLAIPAQISWDFVSSVEPIDIDIFGNAITNSAGEPPDPPITEDFYDLVLHIEQNLASFDALFAANMINSVNEGLFLNVFPPRTAKIIKFSASRTIEAPLIYVPTVIEIQFRTDSNGWDRQFVDKGFREITADTTTKTYSDGRVKIIGNSEEMKNLTTGEPLTEPDFLDGAGKRLADGEPLAFVTYRTKKERNFDLLGIVIP